MDLFWFYKEADGPFPKNGYQHWRTAMAYEGSRQMGVMRRLFEERPWHRMIPDPGVLASEPGSGPFRLVAARAVDGSFAIAYAPRGQAIGVHLDKLAGPAVNARWYDPRDGSWKAIGRFSSTGVREFAPPSGGDKDDWVLVLDSEAK
jgi:hypothetical protein